MIYKFLSDICTRIVLWPCISMTQEENFDSKIMLEKKQVTLQGLEPTLNAFNTNCLKFSPRCILRSDVECKAVISSEFLLFELESYDYNTS